MATLRDNERTVQRLGAQAENDIQKKAKLGGLHEIRKGKSEGRRIPGRNKVLLQGRGLERNISI